MMKEMNIASNFINNFNVMLLVFYVYLVCFGGFCLLGKFFQKFSPYFNTAVKLFKQGMITLVMFNIFNFAFSAGVHLKYSNQDEQLHGFSSFLIILTFLIIIAFTASIQFTSDKPFG